MREGERSQSTLLVAKTLDLPTQNQQLISSLDQWRTKSSVQRGSVYSKTWKIKIVAVYSSLNSSPCLLNSELLNFCFLLLLTHGSTPL